MSHENARHFHCPQCGATYHFGQFAGPNVTVNCKGCGVPTEEHKTDEWEGKQAAFAEGHVKRQEARLKVEQEKAARDVAEFAVDEAAEAVAEAVRPE